MTTATGNALRDVGGTCATSEEAFSCELRALTAELKEMSTSPLRLTDIDRRLIRLGQIEDAAMITDERYRRLGPEPRRIFDEFLSEYHLQRSVVRGAHSQSGVVEDAFRALESVWRAHNAGKSLPCSKVLVVLERRPEGELFTITVSSLRVRSGREFSAGRSRSTLLECEEWFYETLREHFGERYVGSPARHLSADEYGAVLSLWEEDPCSEFHRLDAVVDAVRSLG